MDRRTIAKLTSLFIILSGFTITSLSFANDDFMLGGYDPAQAAASQQVTKQVIPGQKALKGQANDLFNHAGDPIAGNPNGTITLIEFFDYRCPHSIKMNPVINTLIANNPNLRVVYKEFPKFGEASDSASKAALAAKIQGKYTEFHQALINEGKTVTLAKILSIAQSLGLDINQFKTDMKSNSVNQIIRDNKLLSQKLGINAVPLIFIGKTSIGTNPSSGAIVYALGEVSAQQIQNLINSR